MAEDQLRSIVEGIVARLQAELDSQLAAVAESHQRTQAELRQTLEAESERRIAAKLEEARADWNGRLQSEVASARSEVERTMVAEAMRARVEAEQAAADAAAQARREHEQAVAAERKRAEEDAARLNAQLNELRERAAGERDQAIAAERARADGEIARLKSELAQARAALDAERASAQIAIADARKTPAASTPIGNGAAGILDAFRAIDEATSLSTALAAVTRGAAAHAPRAAMFVVHGAELHEWPVAGVDGVDAGPIRAEGREAGFLSEVLRTGEPVTIGDQGGTPPAFARLAPGRFAIAVPFTLGGQPVAVLYADDGNNGRSSGAWRETVQILGRHASAFLGYLTVVKTAQALGLVGGAPPGTGTDPAADDDAQGARRYARLLVSEIKLYNEGAVRVGRERRDLMQRLKAEIDRARTLYEERVPASIRGRETYFQQELVQTLAGGDQSLLG